MNLTVGELQSLQVLKDKGYVLVGIQLDPMVILMVHKDWKFLQLRKQLDQAMEDLPEAFQQKDLALEIPTLDMFEERWEDGNHGFMIVVDERIRQ